jgi:hypothetical protein
MGGPMSIALGESDYRFGGHQRLRESRLLLRAEHFAGAAYLAGRAVEALLRALIWKNDPEIRLGRKTLDAGHDLRVLLLSVINLGVLRDGPVRNLLTANVQHVSRLWFNNMRFIPTERLQKRWYEIREIDRRRTLKAAAADYYEACAAVVKECEVLLCQS